MCQRKGLLRHQSTIKSSFVGLELPGPLLVLAVGLVDCSAGEDSEVQNGVEESEGRWSSCTGSSTCIRCGSDVGLASLGVSCIIAMLKADAEFL